MANANRCENVNGQNCISNECVYVYSEEPKTVGNNINRLKLTKMIQ